MSIDTNGLWLLIVKNSVAKDFSLKTIEKQRITEFLRPKIIPAGPQSQKAVRSLLKRRWKLQ